MSALNADKQTAEKVAIENHSPKTQDKEKTRDDTKA
jgi:hypothetical protein